MGKELVPCKTSPGYKIHPAFEHGKKGCLVRALEAILPRFESSRIWQVRHQNQPTDVYSNSTIFSLGSNINTCLAPFYDSSPTIQRLLIRWPSPTPIMYHIHVTSSHLTCVLAPSYGDMNMLQYRFETFSAVWSPVFDPHISSRGFAMVCFSWPVKIQGWWCSKIGRFHHQVQQVKCILCMYWNQLCFRATEAVLAKQTPYIWASEPKARFWMVKTTVFYSV